ncbi:MAG: PDZ domain-containing protein [Planctomycetaceae bacterium]|nr:PDZ domain-containing protein [Planctomycetaceae bacterium]
MTRRLAGLFLSCVAVCGLVTLTPLSADETPATLPVVAPTKPSADDVERWIQDLSAPEFAKREEATRRLIAAGPLAVDAMVKGAQSSSLEATCRINTILRTWYTSGKDELIEPAEAAFETLAESKNRHAAGRAVATLEQYATTIRQDRAIAQIKQLGGTAEELNFAGRLRVVGPEDTKFYMVILGRTWRGGEEGLKYLRRVAGLRTLYLVQDQATGKIATPGITQDSIDELHRAIPGLAIDFRGPAFLGVKAMANNSLCRIDEVPPDTPAARAKLLPGDVVFQFDGQPVSSFQDLVKHIGTKQPGDVIKLEVLRGLDDDDLIALERFQQLPEPNPGKQYVEKLRQRLGKKIDVTLGEWGAKPKP